MSLTPVNLLASVITAFAAALTALDGLTVENGRRRLGLFAGLESDQFAQMIMDLWQQTAAFPNARVVVDGGAGRQILWHIAPLAARFVDIKNPVEDFRVRVLPGSAKARGFGETVGNEVPFARGEIECISHPNVNRRKRILVQLQNARLAIIHPKISLFKQALRNDILHLARNRNVVVADGFEPQDLRGHACQRLTINIVTANAEKGDRIRVRVDAGITGR